MRPSTLPSLMLGILLGWTLVATIITSARAKVISKHLGNAGVGGVETDLISLLTSQARDSQHLRQAYAMLNEVQSSPTCHQLAAYKLLTSCKNLEIGPDGTETPILLERVKNLYAARLAVCELQSARASIPAQCKDIMSISLNDLAEEEKPRLNRLWYDRDRPEAKILQPCLKALHDMAKSWTSYSNNRAQAITMCHAIRDHLEREETAETHRKLVKVVSAMTDESLEVSRVLSETHQRHAAAHAEVQDLFESLVADVHGNMKVFAQKGIEVVDLLSGVTLSTASLQVDLKAMSSKIKNASSDVDMVQKGVTNILRPVVAASSEISSYLVDMKDFLELAQPFLLKGAEVAHIVNGGWQQVQATHSALSKIVPQIGLLLFLALVGTCMGIRKRKIILAILAFVNGGIAFRQVKGILAGSISQICDLSAALPEWIRANEDVLAVTGIVIVAVSFAVVSCFWVDSIRHGRTELAVKQQAATLRGVHRHDRHKNLAVDLGLPRYFEDVERDRFKRAETAPLEFIKSEWV